MLKNGPGFVLCFDFFQRLTLYFSFHLNFVVVENNFFQLL